MKSTVTEKDKNEYPKLMVIKAGEGHTGMVVLFSGLECGTVVHEAGGQENGYTSDSWIMGIFKNFDGEVALSND